MFSQQIFNGAYFNFNFFLFKVELPTKVLWNDGQNFDDLFLSDTLDNFRLT